MAPFLWTFNSASFIVWNNTHFLDKSFSHVDGSACCSQFINREPSPTVEICSTRCASNQRCSAWVYQPSTGACWIGSHEQGYGLVPVPQQDRIAGFTDLSLIQRNILSERSQIPLLLNQMQPGGLGVVLGVGYGGFSTQLLSVWTGGVYLVDPYIHIYQGYDDPANEDDKTHQFIYEHVRAELHRKFENKHVMVRDFSMSFAGTWAQKGLARPTFIYVDNNHSETGVQKDLSAWWDLLAPGGLMAGNMYLNDPNISIGVKNAVDSWFQRYQAGVIYSTTGVNEAPNWLAFKPYY